MMHLNRFILSIGAGVGIMGATACQRRQPASGVVHLRAWTMWGGDEAEAFQVVVDEFNRTHPHIQVHNLPAVEDTKIIRAIVANDPPEIFTLRDPGYLGSLAGNGALLCLDEFFKQSGLKESDYAPSSLSQCRYNGKLYAMIYLMDCFALLWNKDAFGDVGLDPERPPKTLSELLDYARKLTRRDSNGRIVRIGMMPPDPLIIISAFGGQFIDPKTGMPTADHPRNIEALEWYRRLIEVQGSPEEVNAFQAGFGQEMGINNPFLVGKVAMMINGQWNPYWFQRYGPKVRYGAASIPYPDQYPEQKNPTWLGGNIFCIPVNCKHPKEAWEFLRWTQTVEAQVLFASTMHGVPNILEARKEPSLREGEPWKRAFAVFMDVANSPNARHFLPTPITGLYQYEIYNAADFVRYGTKTPAQALRDVQKRVYREMLFWQRSGHAPKTA